MLEQSAVVHCDTVRRGNLSLVDCIVLFCFVLRCIVLCRVISYCAALYCIMVLCCITLRCIVYVSNISRTVSNVDE
jgi:hypothetical protein